MDEILILLASYNGEQFIEEQLNSLLNQSYSNIKIVISDDGSTDSTIDIIEKFKQRDNRIELIHNKQNHGILHNFNNLLNYAKRKTNKYFMFCDQDDVWLENKVELSYNYFVQYEEGNKPLLVYTNLELVDSNLNRLNSQIRIEEKKIKFKLVLHQNPIYGCTMFFNRNLLVLLGEKIPDKFIHHDHYVIFVCFLKGSIKHLDKSLILYRQHGNNNSGDLTKRKWSKLKRNIILFNKLIDETNKKYYNFLSNEDKKMVNDLIKGKSGISRFIILIKYRIFKLTKLGTLNFLLQNLIYGREYDK